MHAKLPLFPVEASTLAPQVDLLFLFLVAVSLFFGLLIAALLVGFGIRFRRRPGGAEAEQIHGSLPLEVAWSVIPFGLAMVMFVWGAVLFMKMSRPPDNAHEVFVIGKQWMWKVQHMEGRREIDEVHVPLGQPIKLTMTSEDVIHSFFVPAFRMKADVLPGRYTTAWFEPTRAGEYPLFCAEYCGTEHSGMIGRVVVMEPADFQAWLSESGPAAVAPAASGGASPAGAQGPSPVAAGEALFTQKGCSTCHQPQGGGLGPSLVGVYKHQVKLKDGGEVVADDAYLRESIVDPPAKIVAGYQPMMPKVQLSDGQVSDLVEYLKSLGPGGGGGSPAAATGAAPPAPAAAGDTSMAAAGEALFKQKGCAVCHQPQGGGLGPSLVGLYDKPVKLKDGSEVVADDAYVRESIVDPNAKLVAGFQPVMPPFQGQLTEEQVMQLIQYVKSLAPPGDGAGAAQTGGHGTAP